MKNCAAVASKSSGRLFSELSDAGGINGSDIFWILFKNQIALKLVERVEFWVNSFCIGAAARIPNRSTKNAAKSGDIDASDVCDLAVQVALPAILGVSPKLGIIAFVIAMDRPRLNAKADDILKNLAKRLVRVKIAQKNARVWSQIRGEF